MAVHVGQRDTPFQLLYVGECEDTVHDKTLNIFMLLNLNSSVKLLMTTLQGTSKRSSFMGSFSELK